MGTLSTHISASFSRATYICSASGTGGDTALAVVGTRASVDTIAISTTACGGGGRALQGEVTACTISTLISCGGAAGRTISTAGDITRVRTHGVSRTGRAGGHTAGAAGYACLKRTIGVTLTGRAGGETAMVENIRWDNQILTAYTSHDAAVSYLGNTGVGGMATHDQWIAYLPGWAGLNIRLVVRLNLRAVRHLASALPAYPTSRAVGVSITSRRGGDAHSGANTQGTTHGYKIKD